jgi:hypothetical protein
VNYKRKISLLITLLVIVVLVTTSGITSVLGSDSGVPSSSDDSQNKTALLFNAEVHAKHFGITVEEALHQFELIETIRPIKDQIESKNLGNYAGMWIVYKPAFKIVAAFTQDAEKTIQPFLTEDIAKTIEVITVKYSMNDLLNTQIQFNDILKSNNLLSDSWVDAMNNRVTVNLAEKDYSNFTDMVKTAKLTVPDNVQVNSVKSLMKLETDMCGGFSLWDPPFINDWTSGFGVKTATGTKGIATCAHAPNQAIYWHIAPYTLTFQAEQNGGSYDVQWHTCPSGLTVTNKVQWTTGGSTLNITGHRNRTSLFLGEAVYKFGIATNYTGGTVSSITGIVSDVPNCNPTFIVVYNEYDYPDMTASGDSGSPWFNVNNAYGIHTAGDAANLYSCFMSVSYLGILGISIMTTP